MTELRDYQRELMLRAETVLGPDKARVMMQLPTGGGKTIIAAHLLDNLIRNGRKAVWLTHRKELADQTCGMLTAAHIPPSLMLDGILAQLRRPSAEGSLSSWPRK